MSVLVDSSVWIDYFRGKNDTDTFEHFLDEGLIVINDLILAELVPALTIRKQKQLISLLHAIEKVPMIIDWRHIIDMQVRCLQNGINKVGVPDLIIAQNVIQNSLDLYTRDKHFRLISRHINLSLY